MQPELLVREAPVPLSGQGWPCHDPLPPQAALAGQVFTDSHSLTVLLQCSLLKPFSAVPRVASFNIHIHSFFSVGRCVFHINMRGFLDVRLLFAYGNFQSS